MPAGGGLCRRAVDCASTRGSVPGLALAPAKPYPGARVCTGRSAWVLPGCGPQAVESRHCRRERLACAPQSSNLTRGLDASRNETLRLIKVSISRRYAQQEEDGRRHSASPTSKICKAPARKPDTICKIRPWCRAELARACGARARLAPEASKIETRIERSVSK